ncbi:hypothetical protein CBR_g58774 [Chara braunii]|uniref:BTB domain-containing protein n=1 Tax=Chara braunii TaxID=69332 RepID=A0A388MF34_CHABU|nr:hypothetical protein CBR_g58774 [Chara braunii]|eukprot:GBG93089.1 hypothetical protein CBR_g58774 [Chara braunii]
MSDRGAILCPSLSKWVEKDEVAKREKQLLYSVRTILCRPELLDVTFVCKHGREVRANRAFLASGSEYFLKLLYGDMKESSMDRIPLPDATAGSLQIVIGYLHGHDFMWNHSCLDEMVEVYCLAAQYQVDLLCQRILLMVQSLIYACEFGCLLNAAIPRHAEELLKVAVKVMNKVLVFDSTSFKGWSKESIEYCLENVQFHPNVTETMVAEAVLSAASNNGSVADEGEISQDQTVVDGSKAEGSGDSVSVKIPSCSEASGEKDCDRDTCGSLSSEDLREIFECHINLAFVDPLFMGTRIEPLQILRHQVITAAYKAQSILLSRGLPVQSIWNPFTVPWRSLSPRVSFAPVKSPGGEIGNGYADVSVPSLWSHDPLSNFVISEQLPQQVQCINKANVSHAILRLPLQCGLHIWRVRSPTLGNRFGAGVVSSTELDMFGARRVNKSWLLYGHLKLEKPTVMPNLWPKPQDFLSVCPMKRFSESGDAVFVILDMTKKSLTFANRLKDYLDANGTYPAAATDLPCHEPLYPAVHMQEPGSVEIEWIQSSPREQSFRPIYRLPSEGDSHRGSLRCLAICRLLAHCCSQAPICTEHLQLQKRTGRERDAWCTQPAMVGGVPWSSSSEQAYESKGLEEEEKWKHDTNSGIGLAADKNLGTHW